MIQPNLSTTKLRLPGSRNPEVGRQLSLSAPTWAVISEQPKRLRLG
jgi:hypothetical protein